MDDQEGPLREGTLLEIVTHLLDRIGNQATAISGLNATDLFLFSYPDVATPMELFTCLTTILESCPQENKEARLSQVCKFLYAWFSKHMTRDIKYNKPLLDLCVLFVTKDIQEGNEKCRLSELFHTTNRMKTTRLSGSSSSNPKKLLPTASFVHTPQLLTVTKTHKKHKRSVSSTSSAPSTTLQLALHTERGDRSPGKEPIPLSNSGAITERPCHEISELTINRRRSSSSATPPPPPQLLCPDTARDRKRSSTPTFAPPPGIASPGRNPLKKQATFCSKPASSPLFIPGGGGCLHLESDSQTRIFMHYATAKVSSTLTGLVWPAFRTIGSSELLSCAWTKPDAKIKAPNIVKLTDLFNRITFFVSMEILFAPSSETINAITFYIKVARELKKACDLQSMYAVVAALTSLPVSRLKNAWAQIDEKYQKSFRKLQNAVSQEKNSANLRKLYNNAPAPKIPALPLLQKEVFLCYENDLFVDKKNKIISFGVLLMIGGRLKSLEEQQEQADFRSAHFLYSRSLNQFFSALKPNVSEDEMYERSLVLFPVGTKVDEDSPIHTHRRIGASDRNTSIDPNLLLKTYESLKDVKDEEEEEEEEDGDDVREKKKLKHWRSVSQKSMRRVSVTVSALGGVK